MEFKKVFPLVITIMVVIITLELLTVPSAYSRNYLVDLKLNAIYYDNFFQASENIPETDLWAWSIGAHVTKKQNNLLKGMKIFGVLEQTDYESFDASRIVGGGIRVDNKPFSTKIYARYQFNRPAFYVQTDLDTVDIFRVDSKCGYYLTRDFQLKGAIDYYHEKYDISTVKNNDTYFFEGSLRYRGFGYMFSPEIGARWGTQDTRDDNYDYEQKELLVIFRMIPIKPMYISIRYRYRIRDYKTSLPDDSNYERKDDRHQVRALAVYKINHHWSVNCYFAREDADSLKPTRVFITNMFSLGVTFSI